ncbi:hypothetical protein [Delftia acidovorans]
MTQIQAWRFPGLCAHPLQQHARTFGADAAKRAGKGRIVVAGG